MRNKPLATRISLLTAATLSALVLYSFGINAAEKMKEPMMTTTNEELYSTLNDQQSVAVTIYNGDLALVKDTRKVKLKTGLNALALRDVSAQIRDRKSVV